MSLKNNFSILAVAALVSGCSTLNASHGNPKFRVIAFFTAKKDPAHISFVHEANRWFPEQAAKYNFSYDTTSNWQNLNSDSLAKYQVVVFLDTRPEDLRQNPAIDILLSIDSTSFPLGTGPKLNEIWHSGYYPVAWTNKNYRMIYFNMGHNDMDYEHKYDTTNRTLSYTLNNPVQDRLIIDALLWLGGSTE